MGSARHDSNNSPATGSTTVCVDTYLNSESPPEWMVECLSRLFSSLADPTRVRIVHAMTMSDELCVADLAKTADLSVSAVSHQLRLLRDRHMVKSRREGRMVYYSLADPHLRDLIHTGMQHACEDCMNRPRDLDKG